MVVATRPLEGVTAPVPPEAQVLERKLFLTATEGPKIASMLNRIATSQALRVLRGDLDPEAFADAITTASRENNCKLTPVGYLTIAELLVENRKYHGAEKYLRKGHRLYPDDRALAHK